MTRKICKAAARIRLCVQNELLLGDTSAKRDWGDARDYVRGMWQALQHSKAEDFVFATGSLHSVQDVVDKAFSEVELDPAQHVRYDPRFLRGAESNSLVGNPSKAERVLGWKRETDFDGLIRWMVQAELADLKAR